MQSNPAKGTNKTGNRGVYVAAFSLLVAGLGFLIFSGLSANSVYFLNVSEALAMPAEDLGSVRLFGKVDAEGIDRHEAALGVKFRLLDAENKPGVITVDYTGAVPDTFKAGVDVIVEGGVDPASGVFGAKTLMTKCPSKYKKEREEQLAAGVSAAAAPTGY